MTPNSKVFCEKLSALDVDHYLSSGPFGASDLELALYDLSDMIEGENLEDILVDVFSFYEKHPHVEIGSPGPLINLIESSNVNYMPALLASLKSYPTCVTLNVLARVINTDIDDSNKSLYISLIESVANNTNVNKFAIATAKEYLEHRALSWGEPDSTVKF